MARMRWTHLAALVALALGRLAAAAWPGSLSTDAAVLKLWKCGWKYNEEVAAIVDRGPGAWAGSAPCAWAGVGCGDVDGTQRVAHIDFAPLGVPPGISRIWLSLHPRLAEPPLQSLAVGSVKALVVHVDGGIPAEWARMTKLGSLDLSDCGLAGPLPAAAAMPPRVANLSLANNKFEGELPHEWSLSLQQLTALDLSQNRLSGTLPDWSALSRLKVLSMSNNSFTKLFERLPRNLVSLSLRGNLIAGALPNLSRFAKLTTLDLGTNHFEVQLPGPGALPPNLKFLAINHNQIRGSLPDYSPLKELTSLQLQGNKLRGKLGDRLPPSLRTLKLHSNMFEGSLPASWAAYSQTLAELTLYSCPQLEGSIPEEWAATGWPASPESGGHVLMYLRPNTPALCGYVPKSLRGLVFRNNGLNPPTAIKYLGACDGVRPNGTSPSPSPSPSPPPRRMGGHI